MTAVNGSWRHETGGVSAAADLPNRAGGRILLY